jgi:hypothetical protein
MPSTFIAASNDVMAPIKDDLTRSFAYLSLSGAATGMPSFCNFPTSGTPNPEPVSPVTLNTSHDGSLSLPSPVEAPQQGTVIPSRVFVGGIPQATLEHELRSFFEVHGPVLDVKIIKDQNGTSRGYGFITFQQEEYAKNLLASHETLDFKGRKLNIGQAVRKAHPSQTQQKLNPFMVPNGAVVMGNPSGFPAMMQNGILLCPSLENYNYGQPQQTVYPIIYQPYIVPQVGPPTPVTPTFPSPRSVLVAGNSHGTNEKQTQAHVTTDNSPGSDQGVVHADVLAQTGPAQHIQPGGNGGDYGTVMGTFYPNGGSSGSTTSVAYSSNSCIQTIPNGSVVTYSPEHGYVIQQFPTGNAGSGFAGANAGGPYNVPPSSTYPYGMNEFGGGPSSATGDLALPTVSLSSGIQGSTMVGMAPCGGNNYAANQTIAVENMVQEAAWSSGVSSSIMGPRLASTPQRKGGYRTGCQYDITGPNISDECLLPFQSSSSNGLSKKI